MTYETTPFDLPPAAREEQTLRRWRESHLLERWLAPPTVDALPFVVNDGPPFASGKPHHGHLVPASIKDSIPRYKRMRGYHTWIPFGWDCHGLPVELLAEKELNAEGINLTSLSIAEFNSRCRGIVGQHTDVWYEVTERLARFVDMEGAWRTLDRNFMETVWWIFQQLWKKGLIYPDQRVVAYSPPLGTSLSNFEAGLNYRDIVSDAVTMKFPLEEEAETILAWTTTPWSVPSNVALAINVNLDYVRLRDQTGNTYLLGADAVPRYFDPNIVEVEAVDPRSLLGRRYVPMFPLPDGSDTETCFRIVHSPHVTAEDGTGIVHIAPAFGEDDFRVGREHGLPVLDYFDSACIFGPALPQVTGQGFREANGPLADDMQARGRLLKREEYTHSYPHCWRTDAPLMFRAQPGWFLAVEKIKDRLVANNDKINWFPASIGSHRFRNWLLDARDWNISRDRVFGTPLPVWQCRENGDVIVIGSIAELEELTGVVVADLHREHVDDLVIERNGHTYRRIKPVLDCWFESGSMAFGTVHFPFDLTEAEFLKRFPADFVCEGVDQTRGWFYTQLVISTALVDLPPFENVVVNGIVLSKDGTKMSKRLGNYTPVVEVLDQYGGDALRFHFLSSSATRAGDLSFDPDALREVVKDVLLPIENLYRYFAGAANRLGFTPEPVERSAVMDALDAWAVHRTEHFRERMEAAFEGFDTISACREIRGFSDDLSHVYVSNVRTRVTGPTADADSWAVLGTLHHALSTLSLCAAPILPFIADAVYTQLHPVDSVHLCTWPPAHDVSRLEEQARTVEDFRRLSNVVNRLRSTCALRRRQPLSEVWVAGIDGDRFRAMHSLITEQLNIKRATLVEDIASVVGRRVRLDFRQLGPRLGDDIKAVKQDVEEGLYVLEGDGLLAAGVALRPGEFTLEPDTDSPIRFELDGALAVALDTCLTPDLIEEGVIRDLMRQVASMRKSAGYDRADRIRLSVCGDLAEVVRRHETVVSDGTHSQLLYERLALPDLECEVTFECYHGQLAVLR